MPERTTSAIYRVVYSVPRSGSKQQSLLKRRSFPERVGWGAYPPPQTLNREQYFALILFKLHEIW